jgi:hypothetical protein
MILLISLSRRLRQFLRHCLINCLFRVKLRFDTVPDDKTRKQGCGQGKLRKMRLSVVASLIAAGGALAAAVAGAGRQQNPLGRFKQPSNTKGQYLSCEETYGRGWETCGDQVRLAARLREGVKLLNVR